MNAPLESALVIPIPEAEALVERFRAEFDPSAGIGVPAHVTVLYPFKPPQELTPDVIGALGAMFSKVPAFTATFMEPRRFPDVLYLAPTPADPFRRLTELVTGRFPETPPYGGEFEHIVPHLTVAQVSDAQRLDAIAAEFEKEARAALPIQARISEVSLMDNESGVWRVRARLPLAAGPPPGGSEASFAGPRSPATT